MNTRTLLAGLAAGTMAASAQAGIVADLYTDFVAAEGTAPAEDRTFSTNNWTLQASDSTALVYDSVGILGTNDPTGWHHPTDTSTYSFEMPAVSQGDLFDKGTVTANHLALHASGSNDLQIIWTADQDYTDVSVNYFYDRRGVGNQGAPEDPPPLNSGTSTLTIGGTAGVSLATISTEQDGVTATAANVLAGQTIVITIGSTDPFGGAGEAYGNFQIEATPVPEPSSLALLGLGGLLIARRRRG